MAKTLLVATHSGGDATSTGTNAHYKFTGYLISQATEADADILFRAAGTLSKLYIRCTANTSTDVMTCRTRKNAGNGGQSLTIAATTTGVFEDTTNTDSISAGDKACFKADAVNVNSLTFTVWSIVFAATTDTVQIFQSGGSTGFSTASTTYWNGINGRLRSNTTEADAKIRMRKAGTSAKLGVYVSANARTTNTVFKTRKNAADGNLTVTFGSTVAGWQEDTSNSDTISAGDDYYYQHATGTGTQTLTLKTMKCEFTNTTGNSPQITWDNALGQNDNITTNYPIQGAMITSTTENNTKLKPRFACTASELIMIVKTNTITANSTATFRKNGANATQTVTAGSTATGIFNDTSNTDSLVATDEINIQIITTSTAGTLTITFKSMGCNIAESAGTNFDRPLTAETISSSESIDRLYGSNRAPTAETISIGESQARAFVGVRALSAETVTVGESQTRIYGANRAPTAETIIIGESLARLYAANRALSDTVAISENLAKVQVLVRALSAETTAISESLVRVFGVIRSSSDTVVIGETLARIFGANRSLSTETITVGESLSRIYGAVRSLSDTKTIGEALARIYNAVRSPSDTVVISESLTRAVVVVRALATETVSIGELLARLFGANRTLSDTTIIGESLSRLYAAIRSLSPETTVISESLTRVFGAIRSLPETTIISESLTKVQTLVRTLSDTTVISESLARLLGLVRSLSDTTGITGIVDSLYTPVGGGAINYNRVLSDTTAISESLARSISNTRSFIETTIIGESLSRILGAIRSLIDTTIISESLSRLQALTRSLSDITPISESLSRVYGAVRNLSDTIAISESLSRIIALTRSLSDTTVISEILSRIQGLTRTLTDTTAISESLVRVYGAVKSLSDIIVISDSVVRSVVLVRNLTESVTILESLIRAIIKVITDYVPALETDFQSDLGILLLPYIFQKWESTNPQKGILMQDSDPNTKLEFKVGFHSSEPYQVLLLEKNTEIEKISINKFGGGMWLFWTTMEITLMVQRIQRDIPIELGNMEKEIERIVCHYRPNDILGIDDIEFQRIERQFSGRNTDWSASIWSSKIYIRLKYQKTNVESY